MYLNSGVDYLLIVLDGIEVTCQSGLRIRSPNIKFKLLSYPDINKVNLMITSGMKEEDINEEIFKKCVIELIGFPEEVIDIDESPAGIVDHIATKIKYNSNALLSNIEETYQHMVSIASLYERMALVVAHYTNNTYEYTQQLPVDELIKRYTLCSIAFGRDVPPIEFEKEEETKVG